MSFFTTSRGMGLGGDLRGDAGDGLTGADRFCTTLAGNIDPSLGAKPWRAYLSTATVNARDRIGQGPWRNARGVVIANGLAQLHDDAGVNNLGPTTTLDEGGNVVPFSGTNVHDILTGSTAAGTADDDHCNNWTSNAAAFQGRVGHSNRNGTGGTPPTSWNSAHDNQSCAQTGNPNITAGGGRGSFYCFERN
ncbi:MAG: hypothetical protein IPJ65_10735 [Archangiaceae bacterium]|nr:hypothetical protein [Archangiaceae bacterium]